MSRALRLHEKHSKAELAQMLRDLHEDESNHLPRRKGQIEKLTPKARKLAADLSLAIYWHQAPKGNTGMQAPMPQRKWW